MKAGEYAKVERELDSFVVRTVEIEPDEEERVPTTMKNRGMAAMGRIWSSFTIPRLTRTGIPVSGSFFHLPFSLP
jgi:hypothetical protein